MSTDSVYGPIEIALLARLLAVGQRPPSEAAVLKSVRSLLRGALAKDIDQRLRAGLDRLEIDGLRQRGSMTLTGAGKKQASELLGLRGTQTPKEWQALKRRLVELALGQKPRGPRPLSAAAIRAAALANKLGIDGARPRPSDVLDAWAARELGMSGKRLTIANVRAHVLSRALGIAALRDPKQIGSVATAHVLGVPRADTATIRAAVLGDWLTSPTSTKIAERAKKNGGREAVHADEPRALSRPTAPDDRVSLSAFADVVKTAAQSVTDGRFGRHKVFIAPVWSCLRDSKTFAPMNEGEFKAKLVEAHRAGHLRLSRADLTPAMAPELVAASEVAYLNAVFHFLDLEGDAS